MKKISLQTKLEDCSVPQRYIDAIKRGSEDVRTIYDIVSSKKYEFEGIRGVGKKCIWAWEDFLKPYGLHVAMTVKEILQYEPDKIIQYEYDLESEKLHSKLILPFNCNPESNIDGSKREKFDPKTLKTFDMVLAREVYHGWFATCYSHTINNRMMCINNITYPYCIPYNDDTKHLVGTIKEAPEYYRYWED